MTAYLLDLEDILLLSTLSFFPLNSSSDEDAS